MKSIVKKIGIFVLAVLPLGCQESPEEVYFPPQAITATLIGKGFTSDNPGLPQQNTVITNQAQWTQFVNSMNAIEPNISNTFTEINVDFSSYVIIACIDAVRGSTGCSINVDSVMEYQDDIKVDVHVLTSPNGYAVMGRPYHIVKIPVQSKPILFM